MAFATSAPVALGKIHEDSNITCDSSLDIFKVDPTETSETGGTWIPYQPISNAPSSQIQIKAPASDEHYTDLHNSYLVVECKATRRDGSDLPKHDDAALTLWPGDNFVHTMFERMTLKLNDTDVDHNSSYAQTAYMSSLMGETIDSKRGRLSGEGWNEDGCNGMDATEAIENDIKQRKKVISESRTQTYFMRTHLSLFDQNRFLPPGVSSQLTLHRSNPSLCFMSTEDDEDVKLEINKIEWMVRRVTVNPSIYRAHNKQLVNGHSAKFPIRKHRTRAYTIPAGVTSHRVSIQQDDVIPNRIMMAMVKHSAYVGKFTESPFKYNHNNLTSVELTIDGVGVGKRIETDFEGGVYTHAYANTLASLGQLNSNKSNGISYAEFGSNKTVFVWSTSTDLPNKDSLKYFHLRRKGCLALHLQFSTALTSPLTVLITDEREDLLEIDLEQRVRTVGGVV